MTTTTSETITATTMLAGWVTREQNEMQTERLYTTATAAVVAIAATYITRKIIHRWCKPMRVIYAWRACVCVWASNTNIESHTHTKPPSMHRYISCAIVSVHACPMQSMPIAYAMDALIKLKLFGCKFTKYQRASHDSIYARNFKPECSWFVHFFFFADQ